MTEQHDYREISDPAVMAVQPLVSVHMLAYRHERFLAEAIEGVVTQVCDFPIELIIAEDCSPDGTLAVALDYQRRYPDVVRVLTGDKNVGMHANAARSMPAIRGIYVAFCEGDDYWHYPHKLQAQVDMMSASPNVTMCHTDFDRKIGRRLKRSVHATNRTPYLADGSAYEKLLHAWTVMTATALYRYDVIRDFAASGLYDLSWPFGDYNLALFAAVKGEIKYLAISTATWRKVAGSASNTDANRALKARLATLACRELYLTHFHVPKSVEKECLAFANRAVMIAAFRANNQQVFSEARARVLELGVDIPRRTDWLRRASLSLVFPVHVYQALRMAIMKLTAERM